MGETIKGTMHGKTIELEQAPSFPDGCSVLVSIEPLPLRVEERHRRIFELSGAWKHDASLGEIFQEIAQERRLKGGREVLFD
ncbi:hypothetical protein MYX04_08460 [Nitrospiraceae bacterium AH_259_D15_M11_P09]|nr:hypothetical protein [Nitrospiraceae bacterium AH_259_D15_M11_P09]